MATGYGAGTERVAGLGVLGPTRMDYPTTMASVRAVARYVSDILGPEATDPPPTPVVIPPLLHDRPSTTCLHRQRLSTGTSLNDYYQDLGVSRTRAAEEIKRAYRRMARKLHPDVNPGTEAEEQFKRVSQAYDVLSDAEKQRAYDMGADPYAAAGAGAVTGQGFSLQRHHGRVLRAVPPAGTARTAARGSSAARTRWSGSTSTSATPCSAPRRS